MFQVRVGTVGFSYPDWEGVLYPPGSSLRRQLLRYCEFFDALELTQYQSSLPDVDRICSFGAQLRGDIKIHVRLHKAFTHQGDHSMALLLSRHFRHAFQPLFDAGRFGSFLASFPYAFRCTHESKDYVLQISSRLNFSGADSGAWVQFDFRHPSWFTPDALNWLRSQQLGVLVCDGPPIPGHFFGTPHPTSERVIVRLLGRNPDNWWSGQSPVRFDYSYKQEELQETLQRCTPWFKKLRDITFLFSNVWQAQAVQNAQVFQRLLEESRENWGLTPPALDATPSGEDAGPPRQAPIQEIRAKAREVFQDRQFSLPLLPRVLG